MSRRPKGITASVKAFARWAFWRTWYLFHRERDGGVEELVRWMQRSNRKRWPWWTFKPHLYRNDDGNMWQVYLSDESTYTERRTLKLDVHISQDTGDIVGMNLWDETLKGTKE